MCGHGPPRFDVKGKVVFITGAGRGIGKGIAQVLAEAGADIALNALTRYSKVGRLPDAHDSYAAARWLAVTTARDALDRYFNPPLTVEERRVAGREGWILGVG